MPDKREAQEGIRLPKGAVEREKWAMLIDRVTALEKRVTELEKKGYRVK